MLRSGTPNEGRNRSFVTAEDDRGLQRVHSNRQIRSGRGAALVGIFRRYKSENLIKEDNDSKDYSKAFSERTHSTLSMSLTSSRGVEELSQRFSVRASGMTRKSEVLGLLPCEESEHSEQSTAQDGVIVHPPAMDTTTQYTPKEQSAVPPPPPPLPPPPPAYSLQKNQEHPELAYMRFPFTDIDKACDFAIKEGKPIFALFTEFPGEEEVGEEIFSHPLVVEAIQTLFVPVLCVENVTPNTPVRRTASGRRCRASVSMLEASTFESLIGESLFGDNLSRKCVLRAIMDALERLGKHVPKYLETLYQEEGGSKTFVIGTREPTRGEVEFASIDGVVAAKSAFLHRQRVCVVTYDHRRVSYSLLLRHALHHSLCDSVYHKSNEERVASQIEFSRLSVTLPVLLPLQEGNFEHDMASKEALRKTAMRSVPLTELQSLLANRLIYQGRFNEAMHILSPFQGQILMRAMRGAASKQLLFDVIDIPILPAWRSVCEQKHPSLILAESSPSPEETSNASEDGDQGLDL